MNFKDMLGNEVIVLDGAMGTMIQNLDLTDDDFGGSDFRMLSDLLTVSHPELIEDIHLAYYRAGANAVETNTFGATPFRLEEYDFSRLNTGRFAAGSKGHAFADMPREEIAYWLARCGAEAACRARDRYRQEAACNGRPLFVLGSLGPSNRVLSSTRAELKTSTFDAVAANFAHEVRGLLDGGADALLFETQQDALELKAAVMGAQDAMAAHGRSIPIICQVTVDRFAKMQIFNTDIHAALTTLQGIGIDAFGINCSIGPDLMAPAVEKMARFSHIPISVVPNAGLPVSENGKTVYKFAPEMMAGLLGDFVGKHGVAIVGGCCGTTPDHIRAIAAEVRARKLARRTPEKGLYLSGPQNAMLLDGEKSLILVGERLNVRGSKKVRDAVEGGGPIAHEVLEEVVSEQVRELGCPVIDVCMDSNVVDTTSTLEEIIRVHTSDFPAAMSLDSFSVESLLAAVKVYPGRPMLNSISMEEYAPGVLKVDAVLSQTSRHDAVYVGLCTGPKGPGATREEKADLAAQIVAASARYGVGVERLFIDVNVFPIGSESIEGMNFALESLEAIARVKEENPGVRTILGVGNLTNGLAKKPYMRKVLTSVFLDEARKRGLDAAICNPEHYVFAADLDKDDYDRAIRVILEHDMDAFSELEEIAERKKGSTAVKRTSYDDLPVEKAICEKIKDGYKQRTPGTLLKNGHEYEYADTIVVQAAEALDHHKPLDFINDHLMVAMKDLGDGFAAGEVSLPHLLKSADVMQQVMRFIERFMRVESGRDLHGEIQYKGTIVLGTVYQDVHSIGKDLAKTLLENYGYRVIDLGAMVPLQDFLDAARENNADAIGMSALLVQTSNHMLTVAKMMHEQNMEHVHILIGGAPVNDRHAAFVATAGGDGDEMRSNVFYCQTAMDGVNVMNALMSGNDLTDMLEENRRHLMTRMERAERKAREEEALFARLPRRVISFDNYALSPAPRFARRKVDVTLRDLLPRIDRKTLFSLNWRFGSAVTREKQGMTQEKMEALLCEWATRAEAEGWIQPQGVFGLFPCFADGDVVAVLNPDNPRQELARFGFTPVIGAERKDIISGAQYFRASGETPDYIGVQITTGGPAVDEQVIRFKDGGDSESALMLQGLADRVAEDMADYLHEMQRELLGIPDTSAGTRWSPGYPGMADIANNRTILDLLDADNLAGIRITDAGEFIPTGTTGAVVSFHPSARYL